MAPVPSKRSKHDNALEALRQTVSWLKKQSADHSFRSATVVVADTGDVAAMEQYKPTDATTNPSLVLAVLKMNEYKSLIEDAAKYAKESNESYVYNSLFMTHT